MVRFGKIMSIDAKTRTGVIRDDSGRDFYFSAVECEGENIPPKFSSVSFIKDPDFKSANVACLVKLERLPIAI